MFLVMSFVDLAIFFRSFLIFIAFFVLNMFLVMSFVDLAIYFESYVH